jgi:xylan 1,4-beta-xylosidase
MTLLRSDQRYARQGLSCHRSVLVILYALLCSVHSIAANTPVPLADPTIFFDKGIYYLYGTGGNADQGFTVYTSNDLKHWKGPVGIDNGYALVKGKTFGEKGFWAPQVYRYGSKYRMAYTANEQIAIAESDSPLGPFHQKTIRPISGDGKQIDPFVFTDDDGKRYLYHVRLKEGNRIFVAELNAGGNDILPSTVKPVLHGELGWENTEHVKWPVTEGPTVLKHKGKYYLLYSANDFRNKDYAVGYAVADHPMGPWTKMDDSPIISRKLLGLNGPGHGDVLTMPDGTMQYVFHIHHDSTRVIPRLSAMITIRFEASQPFDKLVAEAKTFRLLETDVTPKESKETISLRASISNPVMNGIRRKMNGLTLNQK